VLLVGRIVTMADPPEVEALLIVDGRVSAMGTFPVVEALAPPDTPIIDLGPNVAYPGFIDAHSHWIGDREHYGGGSAQDVISEVVRRGWTSIAELWVDQERLDELERLDAAGELTPRVDAYLALSDPEGRKLGDWYSTRTPGQLSEHLRVQGLKVHFDNGWGTRIFWEPDEITATVDAAHRAGWQVAIHTYGTRSLDMVLDAIEGALDGGPNTLHHRIEHAIQVTDKQLARMVDLGVVVVIHPDAAASDWALYDDFVGRLGDEPGLIMRWRDFFDAGLHVASADDAPWVFPDLRLSDDVGRPFDQIAGGMDGRGRVNADTPPWALEQLLTPQQGLASLTTGAAYALNDEADRGHLAPGTYADITILSRDVTLGTPEEIRATQVIATIVGGQTAFCADSAFCP
jgi:predicted amidohydrolase YtcJ